MDWTCVSVMILLCAANLYLPTQDISSQRHAMTASPDCWHNSLVADPRRHCYRYNHELTRDPGCPQDFSSAHTAIVTIPLTYSATTTNANLNMNNKPGYTFANAYNGCSDGYYPVDGVLLGNSYSASSVGVL